VETAAGPQTFREREQARRRRLQQLLAVQGDGSFSKLGHPVPDQEDAAISRWNVSPDDVISIRDLNA
jgi:hypothetical protein